MKIVEINTVNGTGSTGKIAVALYKLAKDKGNETYIAYGRGKAPEGIHGFKIGNIADFGFHVLSNFFLGNSGFASKYVTKRFLKWLDIIRPDILHLHNLHGFYIHIGILFDYIKKNNIPVIMTLHDCWTFTGQCSHFDYTGCTKWQQQCYSCPIYRSDYPYSLFKDNSIQNYKDKKHAFSNVSQMIIVTPSHWLANLVKQSYLKNYPVQTIYNGIDLNIFKPIKPNLSTSDVFIPIKYKKILLGVANVWTPKKGYDIFLKLANTLDDSFHIVLIGVSQKQQKELARKHPYKITAITRTNNQQELVHWYSDSSAFVTPTLEDNFPTTNLEALACGTPVITFNTGGSPESINDTCGIVVEKGNVEKIKEAIISLDNNTMITSESCRKQALKYNKDILFQEYLHLYQQLLN